MTGHYFIWMWRRLTITCAATLRVSTLKFSLVLCALLLSQHTQAHTLASAAPEQVTDETQVNAPRMLKQMLTSEQAQYSMQSMVAKHDSSTDTAPARPMTSAIAAFLREQDLKVSRVFQLDQLPAARRGQHSLFLLNIQPSLINKHTAELLNWVRAGGHLIVSAGHATEGQAQPFLQQLGIDLQLRTDPASRSAKLSAPNAVSPIPLAALTRLYLENEQSPAYFMFNTDYHLEDSDNRSHAWANSAHATHILQLTYGDGMVTLLSDLTLWHPHYIAQYDHAWLLWYLSQDTEVMLLDHAQALGSSSFWESSTAVLYGVIFALSLGALGWTVRYVARTRRSGTGAHRLAKAQLQALTQLSYNSQRSVLLSLQKDIQQHAQRHDPDFFQRVVVDQWQLLRQLSGLPISSIAQCMRPPPQALSSKSLIKQVTALRQLRKTLPEPRLDQS